MALYELCKFKRYEVSALLSVITEGYDRISMHGVRHILLKRQVESLDLPLENIYISQNSSNKEYEEKMEKVLLSYKKKDILDVAFGDIFLEDLRKYREENLARVGMRGIFPIWKRDTAELANTFVDLGFKAVITCIDTKALDVSFVGRTFNKQFLHDIPHGVDPCGENGEFHSFVYDGPIFKNEVLFDKGDKVLRENRFFYCDLVSRFKKDNDIPQDNPTHINSTT